MSRDIEALQEKLREFASARDWSQFHSPRNLAASLSIEAAEVLEHFQWLTDEQSRQISDEKRAAVSTELADVFLYLVQLADSLQVDLLAASTAKIEENGRKYPVDRSRGVTTKYTDL
ncbi:nucleotide pyrophosphohydrolase [Luteimonas marina]|uniref:Nucleotide pyrophosphohydrolase n=1 Tax=Luteimonas marina TaxID=488485 RepID=A0A5C5U4J8_9GAMM|nr:nucleotide pyrophosphohydrolase [Luteimonas marina]TWT21313.1 nucleotide pyrophosphohydrolase [Luteimonas marina]